MTEKNFKIAESDKIEIVKQQQKKQTVILQRKLLPKRGHSIYECNLLKKTISLAEYEPRRTELHYNEARSMYDKKSFVKFDLNNPTTVTKAKIINQDNCIYISALNIKNAIKVLIRDYNLVGFFPK